MANYIHKKTKVIASSDNNGHGNYKIKGPICDHFIPAFIIEGSNDWEMVKSYKITGYRRERAKEINSVERLSDGQRFTIGDRVKIKIGSWRDPSGWEYFESEITGIIVNLDEAFLYCGSCAGSLKEAIAVKTPVLKTEDGVVKYNGDSVYYVNTDFELKHWKCIKDMNPLTRMKYFHDESNACEYIVENKVAWSISDIRITLGKLGIKAWYLSDIIKSLKSEQK